MTRKRLSGSRPGLSKLRFLPAISLVLILILSGAMLAGCIKRGGPSAVVQRYTFEYPSPHFTDLSRINQTIKVERFSAAKTYNNRSMVFRPEPFKLDTYASNHWMVNPGDMVSDFLLRDLRGSGLFRAVFSFRDLEDARYSLEGSVDEFLEVDEDGKRHAVMACTVTLVDLFHTEASARLLFQKRYQAAEPLQKETPAGLAQAMSTGMEKVSTRIINDIHTAILKEAIEQK